MTNKDIIKQYVDTGICIPKYQFYKLNEGLMKTYMRKRLIAVKLEINHFISNGGTLQHMDVPGLDHYEYFTLKGSEKKEYDSLENSIPNKDDE